MGATRTMAAFVARVELEDLPPALVERVKLYVLDALAAGLVGRSLPWTQIVRTVAEACGGRPESSVFGAQGKLPAPSAAWVNGVAIGGFEIDHSGYLAHPASTVMPAALAAAQWQGASGPALIGAVALGYEIACRVGRAQTRSVEDVRGIHNPGANGPFGSAASTGRLLGLDADALASAFGIAGSYSAGCVEYLEHGSMTKRLHLGAAARGGLEAAVLAAEGFSGPPTILEGRYGFLSAFSPSPEPEALTVGLGQSWLAEGLRIKFYPCHGALQGMVAAIQSMRREHGWPSRAVDRVHVVAAAGSRVTQGRFFRPEPRTLIEAQCSMPFAVAVALTSDLRDPREFGEASLEHDGIRRLARMVTCERDADRAGTGAIVVVECDGEAHQIVADDLTASPTGPALAEAVIDKFREHTRQALPPAVQESVLDVVMRLDEVTDIAALTETVVW